jgi:hypothetical protein
MHVLFALLLHAFHFIYTIVVRVRCLWPRSSTPPQAIQSPRHRIPKHLAIVFVINESISLETAQDVLCTSVMNAVEWCQSIGIKKLTVYDERGALSRKLYCARIDVVAADMLSRCTQRIRESLPIHPQEHDCSESETYCPLTPPPSDYSESRPISPTQSHGDSIPVTTIHILESMPQENKESRGKVINRPSNYVCEKSQAEPDLCFHRTGRNNPQEQSPSLHIISRIFERCNSHCRSSSCSCSAVSTTKEFTPFQIGRVQAFRGRVRARFGGCDML